MSIFPIVGGSKKNEKHKNKNWSSDDWENHLNTIEVQPTEQLLENPLAIEDLSNELFKSEFSDNTTQNYHPNLNKFLTRIIDQLPKIQREVLTKIFWKSKTTRQLAKEMGVSKTAIIGARDPRITSYCKSPYSICELR